MDPGAGTPRPASRLLALAALLPRLALAAALLTTLMAAALLAALTWLLIGLGRLSAALLATLVWIVCLVHLFAPWPPA